VGEGDPSSAVRARGYGNIVNSKVIAVEHRCQTQGPRAESGFMWPLVALKTRDHLFLKKLKKNIPCFYFEGLRLNGFML